jgi:hypothetical protein
VKGLEQTYTVLENMASARLFRVILPVSSIEDAAVFYSAVLEQPGIPISPGRHYFGCGSAILACFDPRADVDAWDAVDDIDEYYRRVRADDRTAPSFGQSKHNPGANAVFIVWTLLVTNCVSSTNEQCSRAVCYDCRQGTAR